MKLSDFSDLLDVHESERATPVRDVTADSRAVEPGDVFVALSGSKTDGSQYAQQAHLKGASAIVCGTGADIQIHDIPVIETANPRHVLAMMAARLHAPQPATVVAVTGTAGKTSVAAFTRQIFAFAGLAAASIGTTGVDAPDVKIEGSLTTPDPVALHKMLKQLAAGNVSHVALEASSHGLDQHRLDGVALAAGGFTNLGRDHLDYHPSVEDYFNAKMRLFTERLSAGQPAVIFADDAFSDKAIEIAKRAGLNVLTVGRKGGFIALKRVEHERHRQIAEVQHDGALYRIELPLAGDFQIANALVSAGLAISVGVEAATAFKALEHLKGA
ncbi:MAG: UDP-N-acetylmuramoyl-L-alanyl-D-glutamate--2,6-diaminopimelate ligase, partial [Ahrensia sp.]